MVRSVARREKNNNATLAQRLPRSAGAGEGASFGFPLCDCTSTTPVFFSAGLVTHSGHVPPALTMPAPAWSMRHARHDPEKNQRHLWARIMRTRDARPMIRSVPGKTRFSANGLLLRCWRVCGALPDRCRIGVAAILICIVSLAAAAAEWPD